MKFIQLMTLAGESPHLNLHQVDGLHESGLGCDLAGVQNPAGRGDDLATAAMDGVRVEGHVVDVEADGTHVLLAQHTLRREKRDREHASSLATLQYLSKSSIRTYIPHIRSKKVKGQGGNKS